MNRVTLLWRRKKNKFDWEPFDVYESKLIWVLCTRKYTSLSLDVTNKQKPFLVYDLKKESSICIYITLVFNKKLLLTCTQSCESLRNIIFLYSIWFHCPLNKKNEIYCFVRMFMLIWKCYRLFTHSLNSCS